MWSTSWRRGKVLEASHFQNIDLHRRKNIESLLGPEDALLTLAGFPRVGAAESFKTLDALTIEKPLHGDMDLALSGYKRWKCLGENIKARRERDFDATLPVFQDRSTTLVSRARGKHWKARDQSANPITGRGGLG